MYQKGEEKSIYEEERVLRETITHTTIFTFKKHLIHIGIVFIENITNLEKLESFNAIENIQIIY